MSDTPVVPDTLWPLIDAALSGSISANEADELQLLLANNHETRKAYCDYTSLELGLHLLIRGQKASTAVLERINTEPDASDTSSIGCTIDSSPAWPFLWHSLHGVARHVRLFFHGSPHSISTGNANRWHWACDHGYRSRFSDDEGCHPLAVGFRATATPLFQKRSPLAGSPAWSTANGVVLLLNLLMFLWEGRMSWLRV